MRSLLLAAGLILASALVASADDKKTDVQKDEPKKADVKTDDAKKDDAKKDDTKKDKEPEKAKAGPADEYTTLGKIDGIVKSAGGSHGSIALRVVYYVPDLAGLARAQQDTVRTQLELLTARTKAQRLLAMINLQTRSYNHATVKAVRAEVDLQPADDMKVRILVPPARLDDRGKPIRYTKDELREMRGDGKLPGYKADVDTIQEGQRVTAVLVRKKEKEAPRPAAKDKEKGKDSADEQENDHKPLIRMLIIEAEVK
jgi:hypothetical protein